MTPIQTQFDVVTPVVVDGQAAVLCCAASARASASESLSNVNPASQPQKHRPFIISEDLSQKPCKLPNAGHLRRIVCLTRGVLRVVTPVWRVSARAPHV